MSKRSSKKRNKIDPIVQLAQRNANNSSTQHQIKNNDVITRKNMHDRMQSAHHDYDSQLEADRLFREMKRREF